MPAPYLVKAVANAILQKAFADRTPISPLKLQKLLYYAHGYYSGAYGKPLVDEPFEAWQYGPVNPRVYREFRSFGNGPITDYATETDWDLEAHLPVAPEFDDKNVRRVVDYVWKTYGNLPAVTLSEMTHRPDSPWDRTMKMSGGLKNVDIPQPIIEAHFKPLIKRPAAAA